VTTTGVQERPGIAHGSAFARRDGLGTTAEVTDALGVRYWLEGSVRRSDTRVRVTARIVAAVRPAVYEAEQARSIRRHPKQRRPRA
jgi:TolB-like protein